MWKKVHKIIACFLLVGMVFPLGVIADSVPRTLSFQGQLSQSGNPVTSAVAVSYSFYDTDTPGTGNLISGPFLVTVTPLNGFFSFNLDASALEFDRAYYVEVVVGGTAMTTQSGKRLSLAASAYSNVTHGLISSATAPTTPVNGSTYFDPTGLGTLYYYDADGGWQAMLGPGGFDALFAGKTSDSLVEGAGNKYYSTALFNADFANTSTSSLAEGSNLYFTDSRVRGVSLSGLPTLSASTIVSSDSLLNALAKLQAQVSNGNSLGNGAIYIGNASNIPTGQYVSGDATISNTGVVTISSNAISTGKILDGTIGLVDLADNSINSAKIVDATITGADIAANTITGDKIALGSDAAGDLMYYNGTDWIRLATGTNGQLLTTNGTTPSWTTKATVNAGTSNNNTLRWNGTAWVESSALTNDGTDIATTGNITQSGATTLITGTGAISLNGTTTIATGKDLILTNGDITVNTNKFTVAGATGNTLVGGTFNAQGATDFDSTLNVDGNTTLVGDISVGGNTTLGDAAGDTLALNAGTWTIPNATTATVASTLNFDSNTLQIDGTNNRVGIGIAAPSTRASVAGSNAAGAVMSITNQNTTASSAVQTLRLAVGNNAGCSSVGTCPRFLNYYKNVTGDSGGTALGHTRISNTGAGVTSTSGSADFAEYMIVSGGASDGDIIGFGGGLKRAAQPGDVILGAVSNNAAFVANGNLEGQPDAAVVGFAGIVTTAVNASNGAIAVGDPITASSVGGVGMKQTSSGYTLGYALAAHAAGSGTIDIFVAPKYTDVSALPSGGGGGEGASGYWSRTGTILSTTTAGDSLAVDGSATLNGDIILGSSSLNTITPNAVFAGTIALNETAGLSPIVFEGAVADGFETTLALIEPTADRTITLPNASGTVALFELFSGDFTSTTSGTATIGAGTISSSKILDNTITNSDINASAAIAYSKLSLGSSILSGDIFDGTIALADLASNSVDSSKIVDGSIVNADINASAAIAYSKLVLANSIVTGDIFDGTIALADLGSNSVNSAKVVDNTISNTDLLDDTIDFSKIMDALTLDASTSIAMSGSQNFTFNNTGTGNIIHNLGSTGDFILQDNGDDRFTFTDQGAVLYSSGAISTSDAWTFLGDSLTTGGILAMTANSITDGKIIDVVSGSGSITSSGALMNLLATGSPSASWTGQLANIEYGTSTSLNIDGSALRVGITGAGSGSGVGLNVTNAQIGAGSYVARFNDDGTYTDSSPVVITTDGMLGVSQTAPSTLLHVGDVSIPNNFVITTRDANGTCRHNPATSGTGWTCSSDARIKTDIANLDDAEMLSALLQIQPRSFTLLADGSSDQGFIAQEVQTIIPSAVSVVDPTDGTLGINESKFTPYIIGAIRQQQVLLGADIIEAAASVQEMKGQQSVAVSDVVTYISDRIAAGTESIREFVAGRVIAVQGIFDSVFAKKVTTDTLCLSSDNGEELCITKDQLQSILNASNNSVNTSNSSNGGTLSGGGATGTVAQPETLEGGDDTNPGQVETQTETTVVPGNDINVEAGPVIEQESESGTESVAGGEGLQSDQQAAPGVIEDSVAE